MVRFVQSSTATQVTTVLPTGKRLPDGGVQVTDTVVSMLSVAVGVENVTTTVESVPQANADTGSGHWMTGDVVSRARVTVKLQTADSRHELSARQSTVVEPSMNVLPEGGLHVTSMLVQLPVVVGVG